MRCGATATAKAGDQLRESISSAPAGVAIKSAKNNIQGIRGPDKMRTYAQIRYAHEAAFALNLGLVIVAVFYVVDDSSRWLGLIATELDLMDVAISRYLNLGPPTIRLAHPKDVITGGYFAFFIPGVAIAVVIWMLLRLFSRTRAVRELLRSVAGFLAVGAAPFWSLLVFRGLFSEMAHGWGGSAGITAITGLIAGVAWAAYVSRSQQLPWPEGKYGQ
jgi:hypothetical protein